jgi:histidyl-tRNA synthetase
VRYTVIVGEDELAAGTVTVKAMSGWDQRAVPREGVVSYLESAVADAETGP